MKRIPLLNLLPIVVIILVTLVTFSDIQKIFFQQDEWLGLGGALYRRDSGGLIYVLGEIVSNFYQHPRFLPVTSLSNYVVYNLFGLNFSYYGIFALILAITNALLVNLVIHKLTRSYLISVAVSLFWVTNNLSYQSITWIGTLIPSQLSFSLFILSLYFLLIYAEQRFKKKRYLILSIAFISISLLSKEGGAFYIAVFPLLAWYHYSNVHLKEKIKLVLFLCIPLIIIFVLPRLFLPPRPDILEFTGGKAISSQNMVYNAFLLPARTIFQVFLPQKQIYEFIYSSKKIHYNEQDGVAEDIRADAFSLLVSFYTLFFVLLATTLIKDKNRTLGLLSVVGLFVSTLPFIMFENKEAIMDPRYYTFPALWGGLLLFSLIGGMVNSIPKFNRQIIVIAIIVVTAFNISGIKLLLAGDIKTGQYRKDMLNQLTELKPDLHNNNVFYFFTENNGFYEFQSGFGQTLAVWLYDTGKIPRPVLTDLDFMNYYYEGIKSYPEGKYGYFMTYQKLIEALKNNPEISLNEVHAYYWNHPKHTIKNVTLEIQDELNQDLNK